MSIPTAPPPTLSGTNSPSDGPQPHRWTREEYYRLGELGFFGNRRVERIDGEIIDMSPIGWSHALAKTLTADALRRIIGPGFWVSDQNPLEADDSDPQPDIAVIPGSPRDYTGHPTTAALIVEIADSSLAYDTGDKANLYATAGIPDYWVLDLIHRQLHVFRDPKPDPTARFGYTYTQRSTHGPASSVAPLAAPAAPLNVADLLP